MKIAVLGAGMVGRTIAEDLALFHEVTSYDISDDNLSKLKGVSCRKTDLSDLDQYSGFLKDADLVICAVPGFMGFRTLRQIISCGKNVVDISFFPENALELHGMAKQNGVTAIVDCGVAPGLGNFILGYHNARMKVRKFLCMVGGLPVERRFPFEYKAPFSPVDVIEEYTRDARYVENGHVVIRPALSDPELIYVPGVGTLEAFNTDGLRSIIHTMPHIPDMKEKTLRYPGHIKLVNALKEAGFFSEDPVSVNNVKVSPLALTSALLFKAWKLHDNEPEFTYMKVQVQGSEQEKEKSYEYELLDHNDPETSYSSMSRTTGFTCTAAANLIMGALFTEKGVFPPELVGSDEHCFRFILKHLEERKVRVRIN